MTIWIPIWIFIYAVVVKAVVEGAEEVETVEVGEGRNITLHNLSRNKTGDVILWTFGSADDIIAQLVNRKTVTLPDERFGDRLQLDTQTGSLTIKNIRLSDSGVYKVQLISVEISTKHFRVSVYAPVFIPAIKSQSQDWVFSPDLCTVHCTVVNGPEVSLSWIEGRKTLKHCSNLDLSIPLYLSLEIQIKNNINYSCVAANPVYSHSTQLNIKKVCPQAGLTRAHCCGPIEFAVRIVLSALVGLATVAILVYHFNSRTVFNRVN